MAHGYINHFGGELVSVRSAGVETHGVDPRAINVMKEDGIDISNHTSNHTDDYVNRVFDYVITVCDNARENCPYFPATTKNLHHNFTDPAKAKGNENEIMNEFRKVRDEIKEYTQAFVNQILD
jgi:arsenate reductase